MSFNSVCVCVYPIDNNDNKRKRKEGREREENQYLDRWREMDTAPNQEELESQRLASLNNIWISFRSEKCENEDNRIRE